MQAGEAPRVEDKLSEVQLPTADELSYQMQQLVEQGVLSPEEAQTALAGRSEMDGVTTDPRMKAAQMDALTGLQDISSSGGMTMMDKSNLNQIAVDEATKARGQREAIMQNAQQRGLGGSGMDLMAQLQNEQGAATNKSMRDLSVAGMAQQRALDALIKGGDLAGNIQAQEFNQGAARAGANDAIAKFNAQNQNATNQMNTQAKNIAQAGNLASKQGVANANANIQTQQNKQRADVRQQQFNNQMSRATGQQNVQNTNSDIEGANSNARAKQDNQNMQMAATALMAMSDARQKEDVEEFSPSEFLDSLTSYKYKYKDPKFGQGDHVGPMAQDLEKSEMGSKMVVDTDEGKAVDYAKSGPALMSSIADLHKRLKKIEGGGDETI